MPEDKSHANIDTEDLKTWFRDYVAAEIEEATQSDIPAEYAQGWSKGVLAWFAEHYVPDDPASLILPDGPSDGGMDIVSIDSSEARNHVRIFQCSAPSPENVAEGRISTKKTKFADDVRELRNNLVGKARKLKRLNDVAQEVVRQINGMRDLATAEEGAIPLTIEIQPLTLRRAHPDSRRELEELAALARDEWSSTYEEWIVRNVLDAADLYSTWRRRRPRDESPSELKLRLFGELAKDHAERGPFLGFVAAGDLLQAYDEWGAGILDSNLRYALGRSEVNKTIETELERSSGVKWFHEKNNGVVLICDKCVASRGTVRLAAPQVVNGGQTLYSIANVVRELEDTPLEVRSDEDKERLRSIRQDLRLSVRIVTVSGGNVNRPDQIAIASNTQNKLSERTMRSSSIEMRNLRLGLAALEPPWYLLTKDGEWSAVFKRKNLFKSKTGNRHVSDFKAGNRFRRLENTDGAVAMMAFLGFLDEARPSRVFKQSVFPTLFAMKPSDDAWRQIASRRVEWKGPDFGSLFQSGTMPASVWLLAYFVWSFWKAHTFPESRQILRALEEAGARDPEFERAYRKTSGWDMSDEARSSLLASTDSCYWKEQVAKSMYLGLVYQSMRVLVRCFGTLDDDTCRQILTLPQFSDLASGKPPESIPDFREGSLSHGPLTALGRIILYACELLWERHEQRIRLMASRQQILLQRDWIERLGNQVDLVLDRIAQPAFRRALEGAHDDKLALRDARDLFLA